MNKLDHIVVAAHSLEQGVEYLRETLGVDIPKGGFHQTMGTQNHLMQLGNEAYLELIAINPDAEVPKHPRWFGLDDAMMRDRLKKQPALITWVMNTPDIQHIKQQVNFDIGTPTKLQRDQLSWEFALTDDGRLLGNGLLPYVIQWHSAPHPSNGMADLGCRLQALQIYHNRGDWLRARLESIGANRLVEVHAIDDMQAPYFSVIIETPSGLKTLSSQIG
jgi:hypothetical protein